MHNPQSNLPRHLGPMGACPLGPPSFLRVPTKTSLLPTCHYKHSKPSWSKSGNKSSKLRGTGLSKSVCYGSSSSSNKRLTDEGALFSSLTLESRALSCIMLVNVMACV